MEISFIVIRTPATVNLRVDAPVFDCNGGCIGRSLNNDWALTDPDRFISSKHCQVICEGSLVYLLDLSSNGTFLNGSKTPIGRGKRAVMHSGDRVGLGGYCLKVFIRLEKTGYSQFGPVKFRQTSADAAPAYPQYFKVQSTQPRKPAVVRDNRKTQRPSVHQQTVNQHSGSATGTALIDALGLSHANLSQQQVEHLSGTVGAMMRETLEGLMRALRSRANIKSEFRINVTTIQPVENNPIKFSRTVEELLNTLFTNQSNLGKDPTAIVAESLNSLADHQLALVAGMHAAFKSTLAQFDPATLEQTFKRNCKTGILSGFSGAKTWAAYQSHYQQLVDNMEQTFQALFADDFAQAYEDRMLQLSQTPKRGL